MIKKFLQGKTFFIKIISSVMTCTIFLTGCTGKYGMGQEQEETIKDQEIPENIEINEREEDTGDYPNEIMSEPEVSEPEIIQTDWSEYFDGLNGAAVIYDASALRLNIYNNALAETRRSPCSTFKIISSLIALENGIIDPDDSMRKWSGEVFWNEKWNNNIDFSEAFHESCVWYFREVTDEIGKELMQEE